jgi:hypothetical protein
MENASVNKAQTLPLLVKIVPRLEKALIHTPTLSFSKH